MDKNDNNKISLINCDFNKKKIRLNSPYSIAACELIGIIPEDLIYITKDEYNGTTTPGGRGFRHACSTRLEFRKGKFIDENNKELTSNAENPAGNLINVVVLKSKVFPSTRRVGYYTIKYVDGPDLMNDYIEVGLQVGVINQRGAFYDIIDTTTGEVLNDNKIQGKANLRSVLEAHPEYLDMIDRVIDGKDIQELVDEETLSQANKQVADSKE